MKNNIDNWHRTIIIANEHMNIQPLSNRVLISEDEIKVTKSGIIIPDTVETKEQGRGIIIAVGPGKFNERGEIISMMLKIGDRVFFRKRGWPDESKFEYDGKKLFLVEEEDVLATITD
ncbi:MAG: chaperonin GroES [Parcubacteria group bacterium LiPW_41]|nr:MAG: chaperonin GroES [Parcubacteria group bacterium LiPW_41]